MSVTTASPNPSAGGKATFVSTGVKIKGQISGRTEVVIDGEVEGRIEVEAAVGISANGIVHGDIVAKSVVVAGKVLGNVNAAESFDLQASGRIEGDVKAPRVQIAEGSYFKGNVEMTGGR
jgi:cytoskeletal protein CcmA (bactofilin family)